MIKFVKIHSEEKGCTLAPVCAYMAYYVKTMNCSGAGNNKAGIGQRKSCCQYNYFCPERNTKIECRMKQN